MSKIDFTPEEKEKLLEFFKPESISYLKKKFKQIYSVSAFETELCKMEGGLIALSEFYSLIELLDEIEMDE